MNRKQPDTPSTEKQNEKKQRRDAPADDAKTSGSKEKAADEDMTVVQFYSKSKDMNDLGKLGFGPPDPELDGIGNWRKILSNFHNVHITVEGKTFPSVEHYFHAMKALCSDRPEYAQEFEVDGSIGRKSPLDAKRAGSKSGFTKANNATLDVPRWIATRDKSVAKALKARAKSDPLFTKILLATKERRLFLLHFERGGAKSYWGGSIQRLTGERVGRNRLGEMLMTLRDELAEDQAEKIGKGSGGN